MKIILRVDDIGWTPDKHCDTNLEYFRRWRDIFGIAGLPVVYGVIPTMVGDNELRWLKDNLPAEERVAVHGWDHAAGYEMRLPDLQRAVRHFTDAGIELDCYIPPFNEYRDQTIRDWGSVVPNSFFFGGFEGEDHYYGDYPVSLDGIVHLPAIKAIYDRAGPLLRSLEQFEQCQCPLVATLHVTWDGKKLEDLPLLLAALKPHLEPVESSLVWLAQTQLDLVELTGPHYAAYQWVLERVKIGDSVLDVGSRYSLLPSLLALRGCTVMASDRDVGVHDQQDEISKRYQVRVGTAHIDFSEPVVLPKSFDVITACWSIQHNMPVERQSTVAKNLASALAADGKLIVVSSFSPGESQDQLNRSDPQRVLNFSDVQKYIIGPSGLQLAEVAHFRYGHASTEFDFCAPATANAVCYTLQKG